MCPAVVPDVAQLHRVARPVGAQTQLTFEAEPIGGVSVSPGSGDVKLISKDIGGCLPSVRAAAGS